MLWDPGDNGGHAQQTARNVFGEPLEICSTYDGLLSGRLLRHGTRGCGKSHGLRGDNCSVSRFFKILWQRSFDTGTGIRFSWTEAPATLVLMCVPLAGSI